MNLPSAWVRPAAIQMTLRVAGARDVTECQPTRYGVRFPTTSGRSWIGGVISSPSPISDRVETSSGLQVNGLILLVLMVMAELWAIVTWKG